MIQNPTGNFGERPTKHLPGGQPSCAVGSHRGKLSGHHASALPERAAPNLIWRTPCEMCLWPRHDFNKGKPNPSNPQARIGAARRRAGTRASLQSRTRGALLGDVSEHTSRPAAHNIRFQIAGEARPRRRELRPAQRIAIGFRIDETSRMPQRTPKLLAMKRKWKPGADAHDP